jgi:hypothetical protein
MILRTFAVTGFDGCSPDFHAVIELPDRGSSSLPDGKPNLSARAPRTVESRPDLSALREPDVAAGEATVFNSGAVFPPEWFNVGAQLKNGLPFLPCPGTWSLYPIKCSGVEVFLK